MKWRRLSALLILGLIACTGSSQRMEDDADRLLREAKYRQAASAYQKAAAEARRDSDAQRLHTRAADVMHLHLGESSLAATEYAKAIRSDPTGPGAFDARVKLGDVLAGRLNEPRRGIEQYYRAIANHPKATGRDQVRLKIAKAYFGLGEYNQARIEFKSLLAEYPESSVAPEALYVMGDSFFVEGHSGDARKIFTDLVERYPKSAQVPLALFGLARILEEEQELEKALAAYKAVRSSHPNPAVVDLRIERLEDRL